MRPRRIIWAFQDFMRRRKLAKLCPDAATHVERRGKAKRGQKVELYRKHVRFMNGLLERRA